jgi:hypothetical protein
MAQRLTPGGVYLDETRTAQGLVPGGIYADETYETSGSSGTLTVEPMALAWNHGAIVLSVSEPFPLLALVLEGQTVVGTVTGTGPVGTLTVSRMALLLNGQIIVGSIPGVPSTVRSQLIPGSGYLVETGEFARLLPGGAFIGETATPITGASDDALTTMWRHHHYGF